MGRAGLEPATLGLKVLHIDGKLTLQKRRFEPLDKPFRAGVHVAGMLVSSQNEGDTSAFALHSRHSLGFRYRGFGAFMVR